MMKYKQNELYNLLPRERLLAQGPKALSDGELLSIIIGSGTRNNSHTAISRQLLRMLDNTNCDMSLDELRKIRGIGGAKACMVSAALEFAKRRFKTSSDKIENPQHAIEILKNYADRNREHFICLSLNGAHQLIAHRVVSIGLVNRTVVHPREVYSDPLKDRAVAVIVAHNHPSGNVEPSCEDDEVTRRLFDAGSMLGISMLDHIIFSRKNYYSFAEHNNVLQNAAS